MRTPEHPGRLRLRVAAEELDRVPEPEPRDDRSGIRDEATCDEEARVGVLVEHVTEGLEPELEPVGLRLVAAEEDDRAAAGSHSRA